LREESQMAGKYDVNPKIPQNEEKIWAVVKKVQPRADRNDFLVRPRYVHSGSNVRIAYPGFLTWLKFVDPERRYLSMFSPRADTRYE